MHCAHQNSNFSGEAKNDTSARIAFAWLLHLRWGAVAAQVLLVLIALFFLKITLPYRIIFSILAFEVLSNLLFSFLKRKETAIAAPIFALVMFLDISLLTGLIYYSGGPMNPFTFLYLVHITLGAILLPPGWSWGLAFFTSGCYASLFFLPAEGSQQQACHPAPGMPASLGDPLKIHLQGMWVAFTVTAFFIVFFVSRIQEALARHQKTLTDLQEEKTKSERMASLATLSAGAAHEFSTPLSTIAVAAGEMFHTLKNKNLTEQCPELLADVTLIREQVSRCKDILFHLAADAGDQMGEAFTDFSLDALMENLRNSFSEPIKNQVHYTNRTQGLLVRMPLRTLRRIVRGLIKNALDAAPNAPVLVECRQDATRLYIEVTDNGSGMAPDIAARATEPFFTTKEPGKGLGLGLFLAKTIAERFGGGLTLISEPGKGSTVTIFFALQQIKTGTPEVFHG
ncbi:ATP-binding protein [Thiovibrio frasassiensis]|uniref:histidine kinase n=1 Tax=Thiovibrio frasassiensis TaxID=2984131 RepID=A0A9X4MJT0_9BACT|nr:ATP-binding protein [Thiovibrio frasassiensis]MDG4476833.1 ATP-binding protein [Thiovibrio frasassiensis]